MYIKMKLQNNLVRPQNFLSNTSKVSSQYVPKLPPSSRTGRNYEIMRTNFLASEIKGRNVVDFGVLEQQREQDEGIKVALGESTLQKLFQVQVDDPTDQAWITEKNRRLAAGETEAQIKASPPFGRPQRKVMKKLNFGAQGLDINDKIELSKNAILQGVNMNQAQLAGITANLAQVLGDVQQLGAMSQAGFTNLQQTLNQLSLPKSWQGAGFNHRFFTAQQYNKQAGLINLYLLSNLAKGRTLREPVVLYPMNTDVTSPQNRSLPVLVSNIARNLQRSGAKPGRILDLETKAIYQIQDVIFGVNQGLDGGKLNDQNPPQGGWDPALQPFWDFYIPSTNSVQVPRGIRVANLQGSPREGVNFIDWMTTQEGRALMTRQPVP